MKYADEIKITPVRIIKFLTSFLFWEYLRFLAKFLRYYLIRQYYGKGLTDVSLPVDREIPECGNVLGQYLDAFIFPIALALYLEKEFGARAVKNGFAEIKSFLTQISRVFQAKQTEFVRPPAKSAKLKLLRIVDRNRNCYPSVHAANLGKIYGIAGRLMMGREKHAGTERAIRRRLITIIEACMLTKQHSAQDLAAGFAAATITEPAFNEKMARDIIDALFVQNRYGISAGSVKKIHETMSEVYDRILWKYRSGKYADYVDIFIEEIKALETASGWPN